IINEIICRTDDYTKAEGYAQQIESLAGYKTESWQESNANFLKIFKIQTIITYIITASLLIVAAFGVLNILIMAVLERVNDIPIPQPRTQVRGEPTTQLLRARNVHRLLGSGDAITHILKSVNLTIQRGEYVSIVGASGSGKSTLLYLLGGLDRPSRRDEDGQPFVPDSAVFIDDQSTHELSDAQLALVRNEKIGFIFQFHYLLKEF